MINTTNKIYLWRIKDGACSYMSRVLNYLETVDYRMDGQICRITVTSYTIQDNIRHYYHKELAKDHLYQVQVFNIEDRNFWCYKVN